MNQRFLVATVLSIATVFAIQYFTPSQQQQSQLPQNLVPGQAYKVPSREALSKPLAREVDFIDEKKRRDEKILRFTTKRYQLSFSTFGGVLSHLDFVNHVGENDVPIRSVQPKTIYEQEQGCFLVALDEQTPYYYDVKNVEEHSNGVTVTFEARTDAWSIMKTYEVNDEAYTIGVSLSFVPRSASVATLTPRVFVSGPYIAHIKNETVGGAFAGASSSTVDLVSSASDLEQFWLMPELFGAHDKYFAHMLVGDEGRFTQRAFYKKMGEHQLFAILEGPELKQEATYNLSFYMGPKLLDELNVVDSRLEGLLSFGWLSFICKLLLRLLASIFSLVSNYGFAIILLTLLIKIPFLPLSIRARAKMVEFQRYQPTMTRIRQKYKGDVQRQQEELMKFYKEHNLSPTAPVVGCLPMLIQLPILFSLYRVLGNYIELYHAPFVGWITDLSAPDPYYVLPILMGVSMVFQQHISQAGDDRQRTMMMFVSLAMTAVFINFPAGLVLYWGMNNVFAIGEEFLRKRFMA